MKWTEPFLDFMHSMVSGRMVPLAYTIRENVDVDPIEALEEDQCYASKYGNMDDELVARTVQKSAYYHVDNKAVYQDLEKAVRGKIHAPTIQPSQKKKNGHAAWLAIMSQYAGKDK